MERCNECGGRLYKGTCTRCGLVVDEIVVDARGKPANGEKYLPPGKQKYMTTYKDARVKDALARISNLDMPPVAREEFVKLYKEAIDRGVMRNRKADCFIAAFCLIAARHAGVPMLVDDVMDALQVEKPRCVMKAFSLTGKMPPPLDLKRLCLRFYDGKVEFERVRHAISIVEKIARSCPGTSPRTVVAAAGVLAGIENAHEACGVNKRTVDRVVTGIRR